VWENKSLIICCAGGRLPKFEIFCVITCGLTTHKISIAAPAEGPFIHYNKENYVEGRLEGWGDIFRDLVRSKLVIMPMSAFSGQRKCHRGKESPNFLRIVYVVLLRPIISHLKDKSLEPIISLQRDSSLSKCSKKTL